MGGVTILIPAFRPNFRFTATLTSLAAQTCSDVLVRVSLDHGGDTDMPILPEMHGTKLEFLNQPRRLGWVGNVNALLATVETPYFMVLSHDDCISPAYIEKALQALVTQPEVVVAHGAVRHHGVRGGEIGESLDIRGDSEQRVLQCLARGSHVTLGWRGVTRTSAIQRGLRLRTCRSDGLFSNHLWEIELLLQGESASVAGIYYDKYTDPTGLSRTYHHFSFDQRATSLADNVAALVRLVNDYELSNGAREVIVSRYLEWILSLKGAWNVVSEDDKADSVPYTELRSALAHFAARIALYASGEQVAPRVIEPPAFSPDSQTA